MWYALAVCYSGIDIVCTTVEDDVIWLALRMRFDDGHKILSCEPGVRRDCYMGVMFKILSDAIRLQPIQHAIAYDSNSQF